MRSLQYARQRARACRAIIGLAPEHLLERVTHYLASVHRIELHAANQAFLQGGRAEVSPAEGCLFYDARLDSEATEKLLVVVHELGHLELHARLQRSCTAPDPVYGSIYLNDGAPALARYNPRSREEAEANAFAAEFLCASHEVLRQWRLQPGVDSGHLARRLGVPLHAVHAQLAEALYELTVGEASTTQYQGARAVTADASQQAAAEYTGGPALVNAGPGTGKTATLVQRIAYLLATHGAAPEEFLVLTFSNDAAEELRQRLAGQFGEMLASRLDINTFHGFGVAFLHHHGQFLQLAATASILDEAAQEALVTSLLGSVACPQLLTLHAPEDTVKALVRHIGYLKDRLYDPERFAAALAAWQPEPEAQPQYAAASEFLAVFRAYEAAKAARQAVDFADLLALPIRILDAHPLLRERYRQKYRWVLVDEYQDVSRAVASLLGQLCGPDNPPWVVGDTRQAIYRFRGAAPENVAQFAQDFPGARLFTLNTNYRSGADIVQAANQLAALMATAAPHAMPHPEPWAVGVAQQPLRLPAVTVARAPADQVEQAGIAACIATWRRQGIPAPDIAVLARRNIDVRNIALALGRQGIRAITAGLATPEGAAGDLAAVVTLVDHPRSALPRLAFALGRGRFSVRTINAVVKRLFEVLDTTGTLAAGGDAASEPLAAELCQVYEALRRHRYSHDAFAMLCAFLFDHSLYLRRLLDQPAGAAQTLALSEVMTALAQAAGYRCVQPAAAPPVARQGFGQYFRAALGAGSPCLIPPRATADAVRVMTCHAAKGLEFPYVIVAGQTLAPAPPRYPWLPPALQPCPEDETRQADALFFVGATRAQQALMVTYATSAGGLSRSRKRQITPLLSRWQTEYALPVIDLPQTPAGRQRLVMGAVWGGLLRRALPSRLLDPQACATRIYLEQYLNLRFPTSVRPLYPLFFETVRRVLGKIVQRAHEVGAMISQEEADSLLVQGWPGSATDGHPHQAIYFNLARQYVARFAQAYVPQPPARAQQEFSQGGSHPGMAVRLDLLAHYVADDGTPVAIAFRPESLAAKNRPQGLLWSALSPAQRVPFVLLQDYAPQLRPHVFSAADGVLYPYQWTRNPATLAQETARLQEHLTALEHGVFRTTVQEWTCDRCAVRLSCPYWLGALEDTPAQPAETVEAR